MLWMIFFYLLFSNVFFVVQNKKSLYQKRLNIHRILKLFIWGTVNIALCSAVELLCELPLFWTVHSIQISSRRSESLRTQDNSRWDMAHYTVYILKLNGKQISDPPVLLSVCMRPPARPPVSYQTIFLAREPQQSANPAALCAPQGVTVVWTVPSLWITLWHCNTSQATAGSREYRVMEPHTLLFIFLGYSLSPLVV